MFVPSASSEKAMSKVLLRANRAANTFVAGGPTQSPRGCRVSEMMSFKIEATRFFAYVFSGGKARYCLIDREKIVYSEGGAVRYRCIILHPRKRPRWYDAGYIGLDKRLLTILNQP